MTESEPIEHILLASEEESADGPRTTQGEFRQVSESKGYRASYEIFNQHYVEVRLSKLHTKPSRYVVDLTFLDPQPLRLRSIAWPLLTTALVLLATTIIVAIYLHDSTRPLFQDPWLSVAIGTGTTGVVIGLLALYRSSDKLLFYSQNGRLPLLELLNRRSEKTDLQNFIHELGQRIQSAREQYHPRAREFLAAELREHRRLKEEAVISEQEYESTRARILQCHRDP